MADLAPTPPTRRVAVARTARAALAALVVALALPAAARAQSAPAPQAAPLASTTFRVNPLSLSLEGAPGATIPFEVSVEPREHALVIQASVVGFAQNEEGGIYPVALEGTSPAIELDPMSSRFSLEAGAVGKVRGRLRVEGAGSALRLFGLQIGEAKPAPVAGAGRPAGKAQGGVKIEVSYVVRIELRVPGAIDARASELRIAEAGLVDRSGRAAVRLFVENPTDRVIELDASCRLFRAEPRKHAGPSFPLILPANARKSGPARVNARILPGARVRLEELAPAALAPGRYIVAALLTAGGERVSRELPLEVAPGEFPGQALAFGRAVGDVVVSPPQIELSLRRGAARMVPLTLENLGTVTAIVRVEPDGAPGALDWLVLRREPIEVPPGAVRRIAIGLRATRDLQGNRYGALKVSVGPATAPLAADRFPLALVADMAAAPSISLLGPLTAHPVEGAPSFGLAVANTGAAHAALRATLSVSDPSGRQVAEADAGFGAWILPGAEMPLTFHLRRPLPPGRYRLTARVSGGDQVTPLEALLEWNP